MKIKLTIDKSKKDDLTKELKEINVNCDFEAEDDKNLNAVCLIEPSKYRGMEDILKLKL